MDILFKQDANTYMSFLNSVTSSDGSTIDLMVTEIPTASASELNKIYHYIGITDTDYTHGHFYECKSDGSGGYEWVEVEVQVDKTGQIIQVESLPAASSEVEGSIYQYVGATTSTLTTGYFYRCESNGATPPVYSWVNIPVQNGSGSAVVNMTTAEFEAAVAAGTLPANSIICVTDETGEVRFIQVAVMPTASADELGHIYQYIGATTASYINGYFYKCVSDGESTPTYSWEIAPTFGVDVSDKADKVTNATNGNFAGLDSSGNLTDSGKKASDFANATHTHTVNEITDFPTLGTAVAKDSTNAVTANSTDLVESGAVKTAIDAAIVSAYKAGGAKTCAELTSALLVAANEGYVYTISDTGTTTVDFIEGAGKPIGIGADVGVILRDGAYKFNLLPGIIDTSNFVQKSQTAGLLKNDGTVDTTQYVSDISGKADKVSSATNGNFAGLDANGNLTDSGSKATDFATPADVADEEISATATNTSITLTDSADGYVQGVTVKGHSKKSKNVWDEDYTGINEYEAVYRSIYVANGTYTMSTTGPKNIYDAADLFFLAGNVSTGGSTSINGVWTGHSITVTTSDNYLTVAYRINLLGDIADPRNYKTQIELGSTATPYEPFGIKSIGDDGFEIETTGKNLFDETKYQHIITGYDEQTTYYNVCRIPLKPNTTYTISQRAGTAVTEPIMMNNVVDVNTVESRIDLRNESGSITLTTDNTGNLYIGAINNMGYTDEQVYARIQACKIQIEKSSTATTYEPYKSSTATITTGLPLRSTLDGVTYDELDSTAGKVITRCEIVNDEIVAKAVPTETPLTSTEKSALASLRTYDHTTHIDATDEPTMTVDYLLNTDNGQAVARVDEKVHSHTQTSDTISAMTGYSKPASTSAIATTDTLNEAIGKLEKGLDDAAGGGAGGVKLLFDGSIPASSYSDISDIDVCEFYIFVYGGTYNSYSRYYSSSSGGPTNRYYHRTYTITISRFELLNTTWYSSNSGQGYSNQYYGDKYLTSVGAVQIPKSSSGSLTAGIAKLDGYIDTSTTAMVPALRIGYNSSSVPYTEANGKVSKMHIHNETSSAQSLRIYGIPLIS